MVFTTHPVLPLWLIALVAVALLVLLAYGSRLLLVDKRLPRKWVVILALLRIAAVAMFVVCLLQPAISYTRTVIQGPDLLVLVDTSQSMATPDPANKSPRLYEVLQGLRGPLEKTLTERFTVHWFAFDQNARPIEQKDLAGLKPAGLTTHFAESLTGAWGFYRQARSQSSPGGVRPGRVLLVTDGIDCGTTDAVETAQGLGLTIDTLAPPVSPEDKAAAAVVIVGVQSPRRVLLGSESRFLVTARQNGVGDTPLKLALTEDGKSVTNQTFTFSKGQAEQHLSLSYRPTSVGIKRYALQISPKSPSPTLKDSQPYELSVKVESNRNEVLYLENSWRWDFKYLRRVFEDDPSFSFTGFISHMGGMYLQFGEPDRSVNLAGFPQTQTELSWFDTLVLGDVKPNRLPKALPQAIHDLVVEDGKSLIVIAGPNIVDLAELPEISSLLPVDIVPRSAKPIEGPIDVRLSAEGASSPMFFSPRTQPKLGQWSNLPPMDQIYAPLRKRPAATILVEATKRVNDFGNLIVVAEHTVGRGRVLYVGTDALWKWQMAAASDESGNTPFKVFWEQALRSLEPDRLANGNVNLFVQSDRSKYTAGQTVALKAELQSDRPLVNPKIEAAVTLADDRRIPIVFLPDPSAAKVYRAEFEASTPGQCRISASVSSDGKTVADVVTAVDIDPPVAEMSNLKVDEANLAHIAAATGGKRLDLADPKTWPDRDPSENSPVQQARVFDLWNNLTLLILLVGVLGLDWLIRLLRGYV